jgi:hypothetical protein
MEQSEYQDSLQSWTAAIEREIYWVTQTTPTSQT